MSSITSSIRFQALRGLSRRNPPTDSMPTWGKRSYADLPKVDHSRGTDPNPSIRANVPLIVFGTLTACVPFYYFFHSNRAPNSESSQIRAAYKDGKYTGRDPRDSPIKTLEQKKAKEAAK